MKRLNALLQDRRVLYAVTLVGVLVYFLQAWRAAFTQVSVLDEGLYLYKGFLYATGRYVPFQDYGPWSNHMPLSFLIPGWVQAVFGPGLRTGRYFALLLSMGTLLGVWVLARRLGYLRSDLEIPAGPFWGALAVWAMALNPAVIRLFSQQSSQGLAACMVIWTMVLILGPGRPGWQIVLGAGLAAAVPLTRINLLAVLPLAVLYIFWEHGRRKGLRALAVGSLVFFVGHAVFWPGILRMWAPWFPDSLTPFLDPFRRPPNDGSNWNPEVTFFNRLISFAQGLRFHFVALFGVGGLFLFWPVDADWKRSHFRPAVFLAGLFAVLAAMHAWAALGNSYCVFCFPAYYSFFSSLGIVLLAATCFAWSFDRPGRAWVPAAIVLICILIGFSLFSSTGASLVQQPLVVRILRTGVPRTSGEGSIPLWGFIENRFGPDYETQVRQGQYGLRIAVMGLLGLAAGLLIALPSWRGRLVGAGRRFALLLAVGFILSPTTLLGGGYTTYDCGADVIAPYERSGASLREIIPAGSHVYWETRGSPVPLLYLPDVIAYPAQLNGLYSFKTGGESDALLKFGHWNQALALEWAAEADALLLSPDVLADPARSWLADAMADRGLVQVLETEPVHPCSPNSQILVFMAK